MEASQAKDNKTKELKLGWKLSQNRWKENRTDERENDGAGGKKKVGKTI